MSDDRRRRISDTDLGAGPNPDETIVLRVDVWHFERRGYAVTARVVTRKIEHRPDGRPWTSESFWVTGGATKLIEPAPRYSAKRLREIVPDPAVVAELSDKATAAYRDTMSRMGVHS